MTRPVLRLTTLAAASLFVSATAAAQGASVTYPTAPQPPSVPTMPTAPAAPMGTDAVAVPTTSSSATATPVAPMALAPKASDDLSGAIGFGVGVTTNSELIGTSKEVGVKAWLSDTLALAPLLSFAYTKKKDVDASWRLQPEVVLLFAPFKSASTRFELGGGLGFNVGKAAPATVTPPATAGPVDTVFSVYVPIQAGVEHFFARWFSMGIAARVPLVQFTRESESSNTISFAIDSTSLLGQLFFYTD
jgi:hypothetical protein